MRLAGLVMGIALFSAVALGCGGSSRSTPDDIDDPMRNGGSGGLAGKSSQAGDGPGSSGKPSQGGGGADTAGTAGMTAIAGTAGYPPNGTCPSSSWEVKQCLDLDEAIARFGGSEQGAGGQGGAQASEGASGSSEPSCPNLNEGFGPLSLHGPTTREGDRCCYFYTQICG